MKSSDLAVAAALLLMSAMPLAAQEGAVSSDPAKAAYESKDYSKALQLFRPLAEKDDSEAEFYLGSMYGTGYGVEKDYAKAMEWFYKSAEQGNALGQSALGRMYANGFGVEKDYAKAVEWFRKSAEQGNAAAQYDLGAAYANGLGVEKDDAKAVEWFRKSAERGNASGQYGLGRMYVNGLGVEKDDAKAVEWFRKSAEQGNAAAQYALGAAYANGLGAEKDDAKAVEWFRKSAEQGNAFGQFALGQMYADGNGVPQDYVKAYKWWALSAAQGNVEASQNMARFSQKMTPGQIAQAQEQASSWKAGGGARRVETPQAPSRPGPSSVKGDAESLHSDADAPDFSMPANPDDFALVIGISKYRDIPEAEFAERDARAMKKYLLAMGYPEENILLLTGDHATKSSLEDRLERWLPMNVNAKSTLFVYYSGHGAPDPESKEAYLVPWDGEPGSLADTAMPLSRFYRDLNKLPAKRILVALDSCFSGAGGRSVLAKGARPLVTKVVNPVPANGKLIVFTASKADQISGTLEEQGHGTFTYYFLKGLNGAAASRGRAGRVTVASLYRYLSSNVDAAAHRQEREQNPQLLPARASQAGSTLEIR